MISCTEKKAQKQKPEQPEEPTEKPINYTEAMTDMKMEYSDYINYRQYLVNANKKMTEDKELSVLFFGVKKWMKCPCDPESDRACISKHCKEDIVKDGICHCGLHKKKEIDDKE